MSAIELNSLKAGGYQAVSQNDEEQNLQRQDTFKENKTFVQMLVNDFTFMTGKRAALILIGCATCFAMGSMIFPFPFGQFSGSAGDNVSCLSSTEEKNYCKTSCLNKCSDFDTIYGKLCCDWTTNAQGDSTCGLSVSSKGICTCSGSESGTSSGWGPGLAGPGSKDGKHANGGKESALPPRSGKHEEDKKKKLRSDDDYDSGGVGVKVGVGDDDGNPFANLPSIPGFPALDFGPIKKPANATPCKKHCQNPCGYSMINGVSMCCEKNAHGSCSTSSINGECYCS